MIMIIAKGERPQLSLIIGMWNHEQQIFSEIIQIAILDQLDRCPPTTLNIGSNEISNY